MTQPNSFSHRGQALVPVIFIMLILTTMVVAFEVTASRELRSGANFSAQAQRYYAARGAISYAASALAQTSANGATYGIVPAGPDTDSNGWMQVGDAWVKIDAMDTAGLINLNTIDQATLQRLPVFQDNPDIVAALIDWRTPATQALPNGAKSDYYNGLSPSYDCKNAPYDSVDEVLLVKGMTPTILFNNASGTAVNPDANTNGKTSNTLPGIGTAGAGARTRQAAATGGAAQGGAGAGAGATAAGGAAAGDTDWTDIYSNSNMPLAELFTVAGRERNVAADGTLRVNINTASSQDLQTKLGIDATLADGLVRFRSSGTGAAGNTGGAAGGGGTGARPPAAAAAANRSTRQAAARPGAAAGATGATGAAAGAGTGGGTAAAGGAGGAGGAAASQVFKTIGDLMNVPGRETFDRPTMQKIADHISIDDLPYHDNLININTAPPEVLATVPGMDHATLQAIVDYRQGGNVFQSLSDLFGITSLTRQQYINVIGHLCAKSSIYRVRVRVAVPGQQSVYAVSALVEMTDYGPRIRQWHEVTRDPGWSAWIPSQSLPTPAPPAATGNTGTPVTTGNTN